MPTIERNIPIPAKKNRPRKYADLVRTMEVGDSIFAAFADYKNKLTARATLLSSVRGLEGKKFTIRSDEFGVRLWRTE